MTTFFYKQNKKVTLTPSKREAICTEIDDMYRRFSKDVTPSREAYEQINKDLFPVSSDNDKINKVPDLYEQYKTYTSALQRACYSDYKAIVDIEGLDLKSNNLASAYKASLIYDWYNIDLMKSIDKIADDWTKKGEAAFFVNWKEEVYQQVNNITNLVIDPETGEGVEEKIRITEDVPVFQAVNVTHIDPFNLYFDRSQVDDWDNCRKIYRTFVPLEQVLANTSYNLTPDEKKELRELVKAETQNNQKSKTQVYSDKDVKVYGNTVEVLEFEGTFLMPDTLESLRRMEATVVAGKFLAKFTETDKPKSPFVWKCYMERPDTGRGQSPLQIPSILNAVENICMDLTMQCWYNTANPVFLAPKGAFPTAINIKPGKPIEYNMAMLDQAPQKVDFSAGLRGFDFSNFLKDKMQNATGITQYMQGSQDGSVRTASEASYIHSGATMRMEREAFLFAHNILYPMVRLYALYKKVFDTNDRDIILEDGTYARVDEEVRSGNYKFIIGGSQSAVAREAETQKIFNLLGLPAVQTLAQIMTPLEAAQFLRWAMNRLNLQGTDQVMELLDMNMQLQQLAQQRGIQRENTPEFQRDVQGYIKDNIGNIGNQYLDQLLQLKQQEGGQQ